MEIRTVPPQELYQLHRQGQRLDVIDVRTPAEFRELHATIAHNVPLDTLNPLNVMQSRKDSTGQPLYVICRSGARAHKACEKFISCGYPEVVSVSGGTLAWEAAGLPVEHGKKAVSLERQVRIAAGFLVLVGVALSFLHPAFLALSGFVGVGLIHSGITDTCGMGMMLAKMPWNRATGGGTQACSA